MSLRPRSERKSARRRKFPWIVLLVGLVLVLGLLRVASIAPRPPQPFLADDRPVILAHQGASGHAPSNTLVAFEIGMEQGADILELDVHLTKDNVVVVSHDESIDRLANGSGLIKEMTLAELKGFDFGHGFSPDGGQTFPYRGKEVTIPTLEEVFKAFPGTRVNLEIKQTDPPMEDAVWQVIRQHEREDQVLINSFHGEVGRRWQQVAGNQTAVGANQSDMYEFAAYWYPGFGFLYNPKADAFQLPTSQRLGPLTIHLDTPRLLKRAHLLGIKVHYWTINDEAEMRRLLEVGADGIITDYPDRAFKVMKEMGLR